MNNYKDKNYKDNLSINELNRDSFLNNKNDFNFKTTNYKSQNLTKSHDVNLNINVSIKILI